MHLVYKYVLLSTDTFRWVAGIFDRNQPSLSIHGLGTTLWVELILAPADRPSHF